MAYSKQEWENLPAQTTPLSASRLGHMETQYEEAMIETEKLVAKKADLIGGKVPMQQINTATATTPQTIPVRGASGIIGGAGDPIVATDVVNKRSLDAVETRAGQDLATAQSQLAMFQDLVMTVRIDRTVTDSGSITAAAEHLLLVPPYPMLITSVDFSFDNPINISGTVNSCNFRIVHRPNTAASGIDIVQKSTKTEGIGGAGDANRRKRWSMTNGSWGSQANRLVPVGNCISWVIGSPTGSFSIPTPVTVTIGYRPAR